jgi:NAD(P)-dependent dehydrogenase (short-subunit alcohol dehydrogenase family)
MGEGIARAFASEGARLVIGDLDRGTGEAVAASLAGGGTPALFVRADVRSEADCRALIDRAVEDTSAQTWDEVFAVNVRGPFLCMQQAVRYMKPERRGSIVNIGSVNAYIGQPNLAAYSASKGALMTLTKNSASYLNQYRIRVNQINPGWTLTPNEHRVKLEEGKGEAWVADAVRTRPFGRLLDPRDIAMAAIYLASDESECVTGSVLDLEQYPVGAPPSW